MIRRIKAEIGEKAKVIATGGLSGIIAPLTPCFDLVDQDLTLKGLAIAAESIARKKNKV
jgi:type III pantothenate kinase